MINYEPLQTVSNRLRIYPIGKREPLKILDRRKIELTFQDFAGYGVQKRLVRGTEAKENG